MKKKIIKTKSLSTVLIWQTVSKFLLQGLSFITVPIFTRLLTPADYGQLSVYHTWANFAGVFIGLQTHQSIAIARIEYDEKDFNAYLSNALTISFLSFVILLIPSIFLRNWIGKVLDFPNFIIPLIIINSFFSYCTFFYSTKLLQKKEIVKNTTLSVISAVSTVILSLLFVLHAKDNKYISKIFAESIITICIGLILFVLIFFKGKSFANKLYWKYCIAYSFPLILHNASGVLFTQSDKVMLKMLVNVEEAGIYSLVYSFAIVIELIKNSFASVWEPFYYDYKKNGKGDIKTRSKYYMRIFVILTMGFILLSPEVFKIMAANAYWIGIKLIPIVALSCFFNFLYTFPSLYAFYRKKTGAIAVISTTTAILNIVLNIILIPKLGAMGAALTTLIAHIMEFSLHTINVKFIIKAPDYEYKFSFFLRGLIFVFLSIACFYLLFDMWYVRWGAGLLLGLYLIKLCIWDIDIFHKRNRKV